MPADAQQTTPYSRVRNQLHKARRGWKRQWKPLTDRLIWFHYETRERAYMLRVFGKSRLP